MKNKEQHEQRETKRYKRILRNVLIFVGMLVLIVSGIFGVGYVAAKEKAEKRIAELEKEILKLSDPVVVYDVTTKEIDISLINLEIQEIGELATIEYMYTDAGKFSDAKEMFGKEIPLSFTTKSFIVKWDGSIKAGVDVNKIVAENDKMSKEIIIHIPKAEILSHELDDESFETLDEKDGLFNPIEIEDIRQFDSVSKDAMEKRAIENGILDKALENAKGIIHNLVSGELVEKQGYEIVFEVIEE